MLFVRLFGLCLFRFVGFLFLLGSGRAAVCYCGTPWTFLLLFLDVGPPRRPNGCMFVGRGGSWGRGCNPVRLAWVPSGLLLTVERRCFRCGAFY